MFSSSSSERAPSVPLPLQHGHRRRRFAPLSNSSTSTSTPSSATFKSTSNSTPTSTSASSIFTAGSTTSPPPTLQGIVFDVDGTLCLPQNYMFTQMRAALGIPKSIDILEHINSLSAVPDTESKTSTSSPRSRATSAIKDIERQAMASQTPQPGLAELMGYLSERGVRRALCTRNFPAPVMHLLENFVPFPLSISREAGGGVAIGAEAEVGDKLAALGRTRGFSPIITRETPGIKPKPSPEGILYIAQTWGVRAEREGEEQGELKDGERGVKGVVRGEETQGESGRMGIPERHKGEGGSGGASGGGVEKQSGERQVVGEKTERENEEGTSTGAGTTTTSPHMSRTSHSPSHFDSNPTTGSSSKSKPTPTASSPMNPSAKPSSSLKSNLPNQHPPLPLIMVGDSLDDMISGRLAGAATVLLLNKENEYLLTDEMYSPDMVVRGLGELVAVLETGFGCGG